MTGCHGQTSVLLSCLTKIGKQNMLVTNLDEAHPADEDDDDSH